MECIISWSFVWVKILLFSYRIRVDFSNLGMRLAGTNLQLMYTSQNEKYSLNDEPQCCRNNCKKGKTSSHLLV